jgi:hypothetical protein
VMRSRSSTARSPVAGRSVTVGKLRIPSGWRRPPDLGANRVATTTVVRARPQPIRQPRTDSFRANKTTRRGKGAAEGIDHSNALRYYIVR